MPDLISVGKAIDSEGLYSRPIRYPVPNSHPPSPEELAAPSPIPRALSRFASWPPAGNGYPVTALIMTRKLALAFSEGGMEYFNTFGGKCRFFMGGALSEEHR